MYTFSLPVNFMYYPNLFSQTNKIQIIFMNCVASIFFPPFTKNYVTSYIKQEKIKRCTMRKTEGKRINVVQSNDTHL